MAPRRSPPRCTSDTPAAVLPVLVREARGRSAVIEVRSAAAPPVAVSVATPGPTETWVPADAGKCSETDEQSRSTVGEDVEVGEGEVAADGCEDQARPPTPLPEMPIGVLPPETWSRGPHRAWRRRWRRLTAMPLPAVLPFTMLLAKPVIVAAAGRAAVDDHRDRRDRAGDHRVRAEVDAEQPAGREVRASKPLPVAAMVLFWTVAVKRPVEPALRSMPSCPAPRTVLLLMVTPTVLRARRRHVDRVHAALEVEAPDLHSVAVSRGGGGHGDRGAGRVVDPRLVARRPRCRGSRGRSGPRLHRAASGRP